MFSEISTGALNGRGSFFFSKVFYTNTQLKSKTKTGLERHCLIILLLAQIVPPKRSCPLMTYIKLLLISLVNSSTLLCLCI